MAVKVQGRCYTNKFAVMHSTVTDKWQLGHLQCVGTEVVTISCLSHTRRQRVLSQDGVMWWLVDQAIYESFGGVPISGMSNAAHRESTSNDSACSRTPVDSWDEGFPSLISI